MRLRIWVTVAAILAVSGLSPTVTIVASLGIGEHDHVRGRRVRRPGAGRVDAGVVAHGAHLGQGVIRLEHEIDERVRQFGLLGPSDHAVDVDPSAGTG